MGANDTIIGIRYKGVRGWLLWFCIALTILMPLITSFKLVSLYIQLYPFFNTFPPLLVIFIVDFVLSIGLTVFSIYTGIALWRIRPKAVKIAMTFLWVYLGYSILISLLPLLVGLPLPTEVAERIVLAMLSFAVWYSYLVYSKRVKATYE